MAIDGSSRHASSGDRDRDGPGNLGDGTDLDGKAVASVGVPPIAFRRYRTVGDGGASERVAGRGAPRRLPGAAEERLAPGGGTDDWTGTRGTVDVPVTGPGRDAAVEP